jgi:L-alanine-DL-glutamate epimerase-like enolase superfamily enzyme
MKINDLEFHLVEIGCTGMAQPVRSLLIRLTTDSGLKGWGESSLAWRPGELAARRDALLPVLVGRSVFDIEELHTLEALASAPLRTAVEMAFWDLAGKAVGQPLCRLLGGEYRQRIPLAVRLTGRRPERLAQLARELAVQGFYCQVLAASGEAELDRKMLAAVRQCVGDRMELRLDGMAQYDMETARDLCAEIEYDRLQCLIDPLQTRDLGSLASLGRQTAVPLAVRRAIRSPGDVLAAVRLGAAALVEIDIEQVGGLVPIRACVAVAGAGGVSAILAQRPTLGVAAAALLHLAAATPLLSGCNESAYHQLQDDVLAEPLLIESGMMTVPQAPGLGVEVDRGKIERYGVVW